MQSATPDESAPASAASCTIRSSLRPVLCSAGCSAKSAELKAQKSSGAVSATHAAAFAARME